MLQWIRSTFFAMPRELCVIYTPILRFCNFYFLLHLTFNLKDVEKEGCLQYANRQKIMDFKFGFYSIVGIGIQPFVIKFLLLKKCLHILELF